jgi:acetyl/propionyl-CoA carboxylase alpha subunit
VNDRFDSMIAKVIAHATTRAAACDLLARALENTTVHGCTTNLPFLTAVAQHPDYIEGKVSTAWIGVHVEELNKSLIPQKLIEFFERFDVRRALADALLLRSAQWSHFSPQVSHSKSVGDRFSALLPPHLPVSGTGLNVGSVLENGALDVQPGQAPHEYKLQGRGLFELLSSLDSESLARSTFSLQSIVFRATSGDFARCEVSCMLSRPRSQHIKITVFGETLTLDWPDDTRAKLELSAQGRDSETFLKAPMAGKVLEVRVSDGDTVAEGDLLFVLESMKMQLELRAPRSGVVAGVRVKPGVTLAGPDVLAEIKDQD